jgi:hypothetical protein
MDVPSPIKDRLTIRSDVADYVDYREFEDALSHRIFGALEIEWPLQREVHEMDRWLTGQERDWVAGKSDLYCGATTDPEVVTNVFKLRAKELFREREVGAVV